MMALLHRCEAGFLHHQVGVFAFQHESSPTVVNGKSEPASWHKILEQRLTGASASAQRHSMSLSWMEFDFRSLFMV
jgi:hypothetical protein